MLRYLAFVKRDCSLLFITADVVWCRFITQMARPKNTKFACQNTVQLALAHFK